MRGEALLGDFFFDHLPTPSGNESVLALSSLLLN